MIADARGFFDATIQRHTNSPLQGKAWLNRGWALWEEHAATGNGQKLADSQAAFQAAVDKLPAGEEQALARIKLGDTQLQQGLFAGAATNYQAIVDGFGTIPNLRTNFVAQATEQLIRCHLALTNLAAAEAALQKTGALFPGHPLVQMGWLVLANGATSLGQIEKARALLTEFPVRFPDSTARADADLALARTFALEGKWVEAIDRYTRWTTTNLTHPAMAQAEFDRAWFHARAGQATNAFQLFTNFVARFPTNQLAARAQNWVGDYYFNREQWSLAEQNYQRVFQTPQWGATDLGCQARMMAARTAYFRQGYADAKSYLTNLIESACAPGIVAEAWFVLGDVLIEQRATSPTNALFNFSEALNAFERITRMGSTNRLEPLAWGKIGDCHFQLAAMDPQSYDKATNAFHRALESKRTDVPAAARNQAEVGIALTLEKMAETRPKDREALLKAALNHHLNVVYGQGTGSEKPDPFWQKRAALAAGRLAELVASDGARELYERLATEIPAMKATWQAKLDALPK